jgi:hypothetical protein
MTDRAEAIELGFKVSDPQYHLIGDEMVHSKMFANYTVSSIGQGESGARQHTLSLPRLAGITDEIDELIDELIVQGWHTGMFVGKLMTSSQKFVETEIEETQKSDKKSMSSENIQKLARKKSGFTTSLFVAQPILRYESRTEGIEEATSNLEIPHLVAGMHQDESKVLRIVPTDKEEYYYGEHLGERVKKGKLFDAIDWGSISSFHRLLYDQAVDLVVQSKGEPSS